MSFSIKKKKGYVGSMLVIVVAVIIGVMIIGVSHKMGDLTKAYDKSRAFNDAELAIEKFSVSLKNAYDRANYLTDIRPNTAGSPAIEDYGCPGNLITIGTGLSAVRLCWEFAGLGGGLCAKRSRESGGPADICLRQGDLQVRLKTPDEWEVAVQIPEMNTGEKWSLFKEASVGILKDLAAPPAHANLDAFMPGPPAVSSINSIVINTTVLSSPEAPDCTPGPTTPYQCLKVAFCVKSSGICAPTEMIRQTYLFARPAKTTQAW
jgi:hypothetical protein